MVHENHHPTPSKSRTIACFRKGFIKENPHVVTQMKMCSKSGMSVAQTYNLMATQRNGKALMPFSQKDINDVVAKERKARMKGGDANAMYEYFKMMKEDNPIFFFIYRQAPDGRLQDVLWVDARSRAAYEEFGDVVCFDTTYLMNQYKMPFANFVGVNHHGQSILLGCALVSHENSDTFEWIFSHWLDCMGGKAPIGILTDQDAAMRKALKETMSGTCHRWCIWHILQKFCKKLGKEEEYPELKVDLERAIYNSLDCDVFELNWATVMERYQVKDDWLEGLYEERHMWVPAYLKHLFWAGMKTIQRVESINSFFDLYVNKHTHLYEFAESYCEAMEGRANAENMAYTSSARNVRQIVTAFSAEEVYQKCYTDAKFHEVQRECTRVLYVRCLQKEMLNECVEEYELEDRVWINPKNSRKEIVTRHKIKHMIFLFDLNNIEVPGKYILRRWRYDKLMVLINPICHKASTYKETVDIAVEMFQLQRENVGNVNVNVNVGTPSSVCLAKGSTEVTPTSVGQLQPVVRRTVVFDSPQTNEHEGSCAAGLSGTLGMDDVDVDPFSDRFAGEGVGTPNSGRVDVDLTSAEGCDGDALPLRDPFKPPPPAHRFTSYRYRSCTEHPKRSPTKEQTMDKPSNNCPPTAAAPKQPPPKKPAAPKKAAAPKKPAGPRAPRKSKKAAAVEQ
ncbi:protein FAR-RED IMPAIRED RESPONSE 1-like [Spinacia oleracea]|uniref:Protein FAR-RED IMPAIRED RESPONSE 1-like n=1 Tax=Spinacia oleracea TaxID=3562 RepID=A0A9R0HQJ3_SPIOL|nr:protein FAR-RED IMPAIRED RESPONSE 1-like [Spinacia oleracea]